MIDKDKKYETLKYELANLVIENTKLREQTNKAENAVKLREWLSQNATLTERAEKAEAELSLVKGELERSQKIRDENKDYQEAHAQAEYSYKQNKKLNAANEALKQSFSRRDKKLQAKLRELEGKERHWRKQAKEIMEESIRIGRENVQLRAVRDQLIKTIYIADEILCGCVESYPDSDVRKEINKALVQMDKEKS